MRAARSRDPELLREGHARLHDRLQAHPARPTAGIRALAQAQRRAAHRRRRRGHAQRDRHRRRRGARGRRDHLRHRLPGHRHAGRPDGARAGRHDARRRLATAARKAHLGTAMPGFPNLFVLLGPNTGLGHSSMVYMIESQVAYVLDALRAHGRAPAPTPSRCAPRPRSATTPTSTRACRARCGTPAARAGTSTTTGRNATLWPDWTWRFRRRTAQLRPGRLELRRVRSAEA